MVHEPAAISGKIRSSEHQLLHSAQLEACHCHIRKQYLAQSSRFSLTPIKSWWLQNMPDEIHDSETIPEPNTRFMESHNGREEGLPRRIGYLPLDARRLIESKRWAAKTGLARRPKVVTIISKCSAPHMLSRPENTAHMVQRHPANKYSLTCSLPSASLATRPCCQSKTRSPVHQRFQSKVAATHRADVSLKTGSNDPVASTMKPTVAVPRMPAKEPKVLQRPNIWPAWVGAMSDMLATNPAWPAYTQHI